jgi:C-terminal peptidase prc
MSTVTAMFKRILILAGGTLLGVALSAAAVRLAASWTLWPNRELAKSAAYVREVMRLVNEQYVDEKPVAYDQLARHALHGMVEALDPHSEFLERKTHEEFEEDLTGEFGGVGIQVETRQNRIVVIAPLAGTPGERAGIQRGDEIVSIDGRPVETGPGIDAVVSRLRGRPKTTVVLGLHRPATGATLQLPLVREIIRIESVRGVRVLEEGLGYVQLTEFSEHTAAQFRAALDRLRQQGVTGLVLDLRNNPGGLLEAAVEVAEPFFRRDELIVYTQGRKPEDREDFGPGRRRRAGPAAHGGADQCRQRQRRGNRRGSTEGHGAGRHRRGTFLRQGLGAVGVQAAERRRPAPDHGPLLHAEWPFHPRTGHRSTRRGRHDARRRTPSSPASGRGRTLPMRPNSRSDSASSRSRIGSWKRRWRC